MNPNKKSRFIGCLVGLAIGDALGAPVEFQPRGSFRPVVGMRGGGTHNLKLGQWTDDTSMALCLADSLIDKGFDPKDQMDRYLRWYRDGYNSCEGIGCFDIGNGTRNALTTYSGTGDPIAGDSESAGNGALMRLAPLAMYYAGNNELAMMQAAIMTTTTHGAVEAAEASMVLAGMLCNWLEPDGPPPYLPVALASERLIALPTKQHWMIGPNEISSGGYCLDSLEAAEWAFDCGKTFKAVVLSAVNLGDDADTVGAITGSLAGAKFGIEGIPDRWIKQLAEADHIIAIAEKLFDINAKT